jgi:hypothetical protein
VLTSAYLDVHAYFVQLYDDLYLLEVFMHLSFPKTNIKLKIWGGGEKGWKNEEKKSVYIFM